MKDRFKEATQNVAKWDKGINIKLRPRKLNKKFNMSSMNFRQWTELLKHQDSKIYACICPRIDKMYDSYESGRNQYKEKISSWDVM